MWDWSETSQTVSIFTRSHGVIRGVAKGSKRENSKFSGGFEVLTRGELNAIAKQPGPGAEPLATLTSWDLNEIFPGVRKSLRAFHGAMYVLDLIHHSVRDHDPHVELFECTLETARGLSEAPGDTAVDAAVLGFQWAALHFTGFRPELYVDVRTGQKLAERASLVFIPSLGGLSDASTPAPSVHAEAPPEVVWRVRAETVLQLRTLAQGGFSPHGPRSKADETRGSESIGRANRLLAWYWRFVLGTWPQSVHTALPGVAQVELQEQVKSPGVIDDAKRDGSGGGHR